MADHSQTEEDLQKHLKDHLFFLSASADAFDAGFEAEAKRIAVSIRVLVHDTKRSKSLLKQLGMKDIPFVDTALPVNPDNKTVHAGLVALSIAPTKPAGYIALLDDARKLATPIEFETWWNATVLIDKNRRQFSRKDIVLSIADQDGGAHVDPQLEEPYANVSRNNSLGWIEVEGHGKDQTQTPLGGPERATIRQICHEVLKTLVSDYTKKPNYPAGGALVSGIEATVHDAPPPSRARDFGITRNTACPCGSKLKYKKCCGKLV